MSDLSSIDPVGAFLGGVVLYTGVVGWLWQVRGIAVRSRDDLTDLKDDMERRRVAYDARLQKAELAAASVERLADAVKYASDLTAAQIANLAEKVAEHASYTKEQFADMRSRQKHDANNAVIAADAAARGRRKAEAARDD